MFKILNSGFERRLLKVEKVWKAIVQCCSRDIHSKSFICKLNWQGAKATSSFVLIAVMKIRHGTVEQLRCRFLIIFTAPCHRDI